MNLAQALRVDPSVRLAIAGAGGKTAAMFRLARELDGVVLLGASAHLAVEQTTYADRHMVVVEPHEIADLVPREGDKVILFTGPVGQRGRTAALDEACLWQLAETADRLRLPLILEADGSRRKPLKVPYEHEPPIPDWVNQVMVVCGLSALGNPLSEETVYNAAGFSKITGDPLGSEIEIGHVIKMMAHTQGGLKNIPPGARKIALLNQADCIPDLAPLQQVVAGLIPTYDAVLMGSLAGAVDGVENISFRMERTAGVILAAGGAIRYGQPKQVLEWKGKPFVRHVAEKALSTGLDPVVVVLGAYAEAVSQALTGLPVQLRVNPDWESGQSSSIKAGLNALDGNSAGIVFLMSDMPQVPGRLIESLLAASRESSASIISTRVNGHPSNPVFFGRKLFGELANISGDKGGRQLFKQFGVEWLDWVDPLLELDIDTPEDYARFLEISRDV